MAPPRRPDPEPLPTNDVTAVTVGTAAWAVLLVVLLAVYGRLQDDGHESWVWIAAAGFGLGLIGIRHARRRRAALARGQSDPDRRGAGDGHEAVPPG
jgi:hypothetical protein